MTIWQKLFFFGQFLYFTLIDFFLQNLYIYTITAHGTTDENIMFQKSVKNIILCEKGKKNDYGRGNKSEDRLGEIYHQDYVRPWSTSAFERISLHT